MHIYTYMSCFDKFITWWMKTWNHSISMTERLLIQNFLVNVGVIPDFCTSCKTRLDIFILQPTYRQTSLQKLSLYLQGASWGRSWCPCLSWLGSLWGLSSKKGSLYDSGKTIIAVSRGHFDGWLRQMQLKPQGMWKKHSYTKGGQDIEWGARKKSRGTSAARTSETGMDWDGF